MINYQPFFDHLQQTELAEFSSAFEKAIEQRLQARVHGELKEWQAVIKSLPKVGSIDYQLNQGIIAVQSDTAFTPEQTEILRNTLMQLHPWRKGPFQLFDLFIDTEWRSDWKWERLQPFLSDLTGRTVLDVGCGSGYHCWRMRGSGADMVVGIDPMPKFLFQFEVFKQYMPKEPVYLLPLLSEDLPANIGLFDTVFSMGVLYHRRSPFEHIEELKNALRPGGELVLETLVIDGDKNSVLLPEGRYAQMRNVWFLPSTKALEGWLARLGFKNIRTVDIDQTNSEEQRTTEWMTFQSLTDFLDPADKNKTLEGHPAPKRAIVIAEKS